MEEAEALINELWGIYNTGSSKSLSVENVQTMMEEIAGLEELDADQVQDFLMSIDADNNGSVEENELSDFIIFGLSMTQTERAEYGKRGKVQENILLFFDGIDNAKDIFTERGREGLEVYLREQSNFSLLLLRDHCVR